MFTFNRPSFPVRRALLSVTTALLLSSLSATVSAENHEKSIPPIELNATQLEAFNIQFAAVSATNSVPSSPYVAKSIVPINQRYALTMPIEGQITALKHVHGRIQKGDVIATYYSANYVSLQSDYLNTLADLKTAWAALKRIKKLSQSGAVSSKQQQIAQSNVRKLQNQKSQLKHKLLFIGMPQDRLNKLNASRQLQPGTLELKAPVSGELFNAEVQLGQRISAQAPIIFIAKIDPIVLDVDVPVKEAKLIQEGFKVQLIGENKMGIVAHKADFVKSHTQTIELHTLFDNADFSIKPGQVFQVTFIFKTPAFKTSINALTSINDQQTIFIKQGDKIQGIAIKVLQVQNGQLFFTPLEAEHIQAGTQVVIHGTSSLKASLEEGEE